MTPFFTETFLINIENNHICYYNIDEELYLCGRGIAKVFNFPKGFYLPGFTLKCYKKKVEGGVKMCILNAAMDDRYYYIIFNGLVVEIDKSIYGLAKEYDMINQSFWVKLQPIKN